MYNSPLISQFNSVKLISKENLWKMKHNNDNHKNEASKKEI